MAIYKAEIKSGNEKIVSSAEGEYGGSGNAEAVEPEGAEYDESETDKIGRTLQEASQIITETLDDERTWPEMQSWELKRANEACKTVLSHSEANGTQKSDARAMSYAIRREWARRNRLAKDNPAEAKREAEARDDISERTGKPKKAPRGKPFEKGRDKRRNGAEGADGEEGEGEGDSPDLQDMSEGLPSESTESKDGLMESVIRRIAREEDYKVVKAVDANFLALSKHMAKIEKLARSGGTGGRTIIIDKHTDAHIEIGEDVHEALDRVLRCVRAGFQNIWIAGPAGSGKTTLAKQLNDVLSKIPEGGYIDDFASLSVTTGMTEGAIMGRMLPRGESGSFEYVETDFIRIYENGGVFLFDEMDGADANVTLVLNGALENGRVFLPNRVGRTLCRRHDKAIIICAANTWGHGQNRQYIGRNMLDGAFLSRFEGAQLSVDFDRALEKKLCGDEEVLAEVWRIRDRMRELGIQRLWGSTRTIVRVARWRATGMSVKAAVRTVLGDGWTPDDLAKIGYSGAKPAGAL